MGGEVIRLKPLTLAAANAYIEEHHRHHGAAVGCKFAIGLIDDTDELRGVVLTGRPVARMLDDGYTAEVTRLCTDGIKNGCSFLYSAAARAARAMGYTKIVTYILESEDGASLRASGWVFGGIRGGGSWHRVNRQRTDKAPLCRKKQFYKLL
jgi:hypothetical protein